MTYRTHIIGGIALATLMSRAVEPQLGTEIVLYYGMAVVGSILPDIDHPRSWLSQQIPVLHYPFKIFGHRGATHSLLAAAIVFFIMGAIFGGSVITTGITIGYVSHILLDMLNPRGVPLIYPITKEKYKIARIHTGEWGEYVVASILIVRIVCFLIL
ncbi:MAG: metal-dependent hydrolase [Cellulosilyticaceae bacterium]